MIVEFGVPPITKTCCIIIYNIYLLFCLPHYNHDQGRMVDVHNKANSIGHNITQRTFTHIFQKHEKFTVHKKFKKKNGKL